MPRSDSSAYLSNPRLKRAGVNIPFTMKELQEYQKCATDPIYFIRNYVKIVHVDRGEILFNMWDFQEKMVRLFLKNRFCIVKMPRQTGKCLQQDACINIRNRITGEEKIVTIKEFYSMHDPNSVRKILSKLQDIVVRWVRQKSKILQRYLPNNGTNG